MAKQSKGYYANKLYADCIFILECLYHPYSPKKMWNGHKLKTQKVASFNNLKKRIRWIGQRVYKRLMSLIPINLMCVLFRLFFFIFCFHHQRR